MKYSDFLLEQAVTLYYHNNRWGRMEDWNNGKGISTGQGFPETGF
jgi:hypothetical protein